MTLATGRQPVFGIDNALTASGTITASNEIAGFGKAYAYDWKTNTRWGAASGTQTLTLDRGSGNTSTCDYFAVGAHNLSDVGATITLQSSTDGSSWTDRAAATPAGNAVVIKTFAAINARYWRVRVTGSSGSIYIGCVAFGQRLEPPSPMMVGFTPPKYGRDDVVMQSISEGGHFCGSSLIAQRNTCEISLQFLEPSWVTTNWLTFLNHVRVKPFFFLWDKDNHADDAALLWVRNGETPRIKYTHTRMMGADIDCEGLV